VQALLTIDELRALDKEALIAVLVLLQGQMQGLVAQMQMQKKEHEAVVAELAQCRARLALNSTNSSKPPSSDGLNKPNPKSLRQSGQRPSGGQKGHEGNTLRQADQPDHVVEHGPDLSRCDVCGLDLECEVEQVRQVFDLPPVRHEVTEHRRLRAQCRCGKEHSGVFPAEVVAPAQYGPRVLAAAVYLNQHQMLPQQRTAELLGALCDLPMSAATVQAATRRVQAEIEPTVQAIGQALLKAPVVGADETGARVAKQLHWLHVLCTTTLVYMRHHAKRGKEAFDDIGLLQHYLGVLVHDGWKPYWLLTCMHALCNAHHLRELKFLAEEFKQGWAQEMMVLLSLACHEVNRSAEQVLTAERMQHFEGEFERILVAGEREHPRVLAQPGQRGRPKQSKATNLLGRLREHEQAVWRFARETLVPFTNNTSEQQMRMPKVKLKVAGTFRTEAGADTFCTIRSYLTTMVRQGRNAFECLALVLQGQVPQPRFD
jgi:transposase